MNEKNFTDAEIDVLYYLYDNPGSSARSILNAVTLFKSAVAVDNTLERLRKLSLVSCSRNVIFSVTKIAGCLIGKSEPDKYAKAEIERRQLGGFRLKRRTNYKWGEPQVSKLGVSKGDAAIKSILREKNQPKSAPLKKHLLPSDIIEDWKFNEKELNALDSKDGEQLKDVDSSLLTNFQVRRILDDSGYLTGLGQSLFAGDAKPPFNTACFGLSRKERVVVEVMSRSRKLTAKMTVLRESLTLVGEDKGELKDILSSLIKKGVVVYKKNKVYYLTHIAAVSFGLRRFTKKSDTKLFNKIENGATLLSKVKQTVWLGYEFEDDKSRSTVNEEPLSDSNERIAFVVESDDSADESAVEELEQVDTDADTDADAATEDVSSTEKEGFDSLTEQYTLEGFESIDLNHFDHDKIIGGVEHDLSGLSDILNKEPLSFELVEEKIAALKRMITFFDYSGSKFLVAVLSSMLDDYEKINKG